MIEILFKEICERSCYMIIIEHEMKIRAIGTAQLIIGSQKEHITVLLKPVTNIHDIEGAVVPNSTLKY